ncbi:MAG TPA: SUMF1/EgtB/PvdO family nonheme iron enzyme [Anaerolineae bacterium]|nr:SUMF1/EgtB/PvdO family nonheme iron enzyme [Anaerolineae bacterium]
MVKETIFQQLVDTLIQTGFFEERRWLTLFTAEPIQRWQVGVPTNGSSQLDRIYDLINYLHRQEDDDGQPAIVLYLIVLRENFSPHDKLYVQLTGLIDAIRAQGELAVPRLRETENRQQLLKRILPDLQPYLEWLGRRCNIMPLTTVDANQREDTQLALSAIFVSLDAGESWLDESEIDGGERGAKYSAVIGHIHHNERLVLLGDPGSGKSTALRFVAYCLTQALLKPEEGWLRQLSWPVYGKDEQIALASWQHEGLIPILIDLKEIDQETYQADDTVSLWHWLATRLANEDVPASAIAALQKMAQLAEGVVWLFDGVDEVPIKQRKDIWRMIKQLEQGVYGGGRWVTTCRVLSFVAAEAPTQMGQQQIKPLREEQQIDFVTKWYQALVVSGDVTKAEAASKIGSLRKALTVPSVARLAENPMLLTLMAIVHATRGQLPDQRAKLYDICVEMMLIRWQQQRGLPDILETLEIEFEELERLVWEIGWVAHQSSDGAGQRADQTESLLSEAQILEIARQYLGDDIVKRAQFIDYTEKRAHLLVGRGGEKERLYSFPHRTFQEYLAACYLAKEWDLGDELAELAVEGAKWREVFVLIAGILTFNHNQWERVLHILRDLLPTTLPTPSDQAGWYRIWLGAEMAAVVGWERIQKKRRGAQQYAQIKEQLVALVAGGQLTPRQRLAAADVLAKIGDSRPGVGYVVDEAGRKIPDVVWGGVVAEGVYEVGGWGGFKEGTKVSIEESYRLAKYLITQAQFQCFVDADDFEAAEWWRDMPSDVERLPATRWLVANRPQEGVSWYQAIAFCRWLSDKLGYDVDLPHEYEWEVAGRYGHSGRYAWGDDWDLEKTNSAGRLGATSAVGMYPLGRQPDLDLYDMTGNVWEWCRNSYQDVEDIIISGASRVVRGGSWNDGQYDSQVTDRGSSRPFSRLLSVGFRVVVRGMGPHQNDH